MLSGLLKFRLLCALAAAVFLSACGGGAAKPPAPEGIMAVEARLAPPPAEAVRIVVANVPPGRQIDRLTLIDDNGGRHRAETLVPVSVAEGGTTARPKFSLNVRGGSSTGIEPEVGIGWNIMRAGPDRASRQVEAEVPIPDPAAYRANARRWRVEVDFTEIDGEKRTLGFPVSGP